MFKTYVEFSPLAIIIITDFSSDSFVEVSEMSAGPLMIEDAAEPVLFSVETQEDLLPDERTQIL